MTADDARDQRRRAIEHRAAVLHRDRQGRVGDRWVLAGRHPALGLVVLVRVAEAVKQEQEACSA